VEQIVGIELLCAAQALELRVSALASEHPGGPASGARPGAGVIEALAMVRARIPPLAADREPGPDLEAALRLVRDGALAALA
jgi:histidine ammonia-lyase